MGKLSKFLCLHFIDNFFFIDKYDIVSISLVGHSVLRAQYEKIMYRQSMGDKFGNEPPILEIIQQDEHNNTPETVFPKFRSSSRNKTYYPYLENNNNKSK